MSYEYDYRPPSPKPVLDTSGESSPAPAATPSVSVPDGMTEGKFVLERRPGGCDMIPPTPKPVLQHDDAEYTFASSETAQSEAQSDVAGIGANEVRSVLGGIGSIAVWGCVLLVLAWVFSASAPFLANALTLNGWRLWTTLALGLLPVALVAFLFGFALIRLRRMPKTVQMKAAAFADKAELQRRLTAEFVDTIGDPEKYATQNGFSDSGKGRTKSEVIDSLNRLKGDSTSRFPDSRSWLVEFGRFQKMQDDRAMEIVGTAWKLVAVKTAASPWKIVDMLAVVFNSTVMIVRLSRLYNRRLSDAAALGLAIRWIAGICIAGEMGEAMQNAAEWTSASDLISATYKPLAGVVGKVAEGGANALLVRRLGRRAMSEFRPLA